MKLTGESKFLIGIAIATIAFIGGAMFFFSRPAPAAQIVPREELVSGGAYTKGNASASAYLVEFSDFQCPACKAFKPVVDEIIQQNKDNLLFVYRHFPLEQHEFAIDAAKTAEAAGAQGKFWEMYDLLFSNQESFSKTTWSELATQLGLDMTKFESDRTNSKIEEKIMADRSYGLGLGVNSTPTFFLNGVKLKLNSFDDLQNAVQMAVNQ